MELPHNRERDSEGSFDSRPTALTEMRRSLIGPPQEIHETGELISQAERNQVSDRLFRNQVLEKARNSFEVQHSIEARESISGSSRGLLKSVQESLRGRHKAGAWLANIDEDPTFSRRVIIPIVPGEPLFLAKTPPTLEILAVLEPLENMSISGNRVYLNNVFVVPNHCQIFFESGGFHLATDEKFGAMNTFVNGEDLYQTFNPYTGLYQRQLRHGDRIIVGSFHTFVFEEAGDRPDEDREEVDWEFCQMEKFEKQEKFDQLKIDCIFRENLEELREKQERLQAEYRGATESIQRRYDALEEEKEAAIRAEEVRKGRELSQEDLERLHLAFSKRIQELLAEQHRNERRFEQYHKILEKEAEINNISRVLSMNLERQFLLVHGKLKEGNQIAKLLGRRVEFAAFIASLDVINVIETEGPLLDQFILKVKVVNRETNWINYWTCDKFAQRLIAMRELLDEFGRTGSATVPPESDPFFDPKELKLVACGFVLVKNVLYRFSLKPKVGLMFMEGEWGYAKCQILPLDRLGNPIDESDKKNQVKRPMDLVMREEVASFMFVVKKVVVYDFKRVAGKDVSLELAMRGGVVSVGTRSESFQFSDCEKKLNWATPVTVDPVTEAVIDDFISKKLRINVYIDENLVEPPGPKAGLGRFSKRGTRAEGVPMPPALPRKTGCRLF